MKNQKGITLIALVITIIVLLILAAVSIAMLTGENGILTKARDSRDETNKGTAIEKINMELNALKAEYLAADNKTGFTYSTEASIIANLGADANTKKDSAGITYAVTTTSGVSITATLPDGTTTVTGSINNSGVITPAAVNTP